MRMLSCTWNKPCRLNAALHGIQLVWFERWWWGFNVFRVVNTAKKNQQGWSNQRCLPEELDVSMLPHPTSPTIFHFLEGCDVPPWADINFVAYPKRQVFVALAAFQRPNLRSLAHHAPSSPSCTAELCRCPRSLPCHLLRRLNRGEGSEGNLPVLQMSFLCRASN